MLPEQVQKLPRAVKEIPGVAKAKIAAAKESYKKFEADTPITQMPKKIAGNAYTYVESSIPTAKQSVKASVGSAYTFFLGLYSWALSQCTKGWEASKSFVTEACPCTAAKNFYAEKVRPPLAGAVAKAKTAGMPAFTAVDTKVVKPVTSFVTKKYSEVKDIVTPKVEEAKKVFFTIPGVEKMTGLYEVAWDKLETVAATVEGAKTSVKEKFSNFTEGAIDLKASGYNKMSLMASSFSDTALPALPRTKTLELMRSVPKKVLETSENVVQRLPSSLRTQLDLYFGEHAKWVKSKVL